MEQLRTLISKEVVVGLLCNMGSMTGQRPVHKVGGPYWGLGGRVRSGGSSAGIQVGRCGRAGAKVVNRLAFPLQPPVSASDEN